MAKVIINGRLRTLPNVSFGKALVSAKGEVLVARLDRAATASYVRDGELPRGVATTTNDAPMLAHPWDVLDGLGAGIADDIARIKHLSTSDYKLANPSGGLAAFAVAVLDAYPPPAGPSFMGTHPVLVHQTATIALLGLGLAVALIFRPKAVGM
jgi:hypothetical protein